MSQVWVEDVAKAHVVSLSSPNIKDGDVLVLVGNRGAGWAWNSVALCIRQMFPDAVASGLLNPNHDQESMSLRFDARSTEEKLGWQFKGPEIWASEVVGQYLRIR